jgi:Rrf2 family iron-sulfur cluster assembly transcriptional regulator
MWVNGLTRSFDSMRLSRESEYGLEGLKVLARQPAGEVMLLQDIATAGKLPERFLAKIFQKLSRRGVALSHRGAVRGYSLARPAGAITLREILEAIEGQGLFDRCVFRPAHCSPRRPCSLHDRWVTLKPKLERMLETTTLEELATIRSRSARQR